MKIGIYGFGAVGAALYREMCGYSGLHVLVDEERYKRYSETRFVINDVEYVLPLITSGIMDVIIVSVKNYHLRASLEGMRKFVGKNTIILPLLNGIDAYSVIKEFYPFNRVLHGVINVEANKSGNVIKTSKIINLQYGYRFNTTLKPELMALRRIFNKYKINNNIYYNMERRVWHKWMLNMGINQVSALMNYSYKDMNNPLIRALLHDIYMEVYRVSTYYNVGLDLYDVEDLDNMANNFRSDRVTSLTIDMNSGIENELDVFSKRLIELAENKGIDVPINKTLYRLLKSRQKNN